MNGDSFCDLNFKKFWQFHLDKHSKASIALSSISDTSRFGKVELGNSDKIIEFQEKRTESGQGLINAGIYLIKKTLIAEIPMGKKVSIERDIFPTWIGKEFYGYKENSNFIDIGAPESYAGADKFFSAI